MIRTWSETHPTAAGLYWISVPPAMRNPSPWKQLVPVFQILITPSGDVFDLSNGQTEPLYSVASLPSVAGVKFKSAVGRMPADPFLR